MNLIQVAISLLAIGVIGLVANLATPYGALLTTGASIAAILTLVITLVETFVPPIDRPLGPRRDRFLERLFRSRRSAGGAAPPLPFHLILALIVLLIIVAAYGGLRLHSAFASAKAWGDVYSSVFANLDNMALAMLYPAVIIVMAVLLYDKVRVAGRLDYQRAHLRKLAGSLAAIERDISSVSALASDAGAYVRFQDLMAGIMRHAMGACRRPHSPMLRTIRSRVGSPERTRAFLMLALPAEKRFSLLAAHVDAGRGDATGEQLGHDLVHDVQEHGTCMLDVVEFTNKYIQTCDARKELSWIARKRSHRKALAKFRKSVQGITSTVGYVFCLAASLHFDHAYQKCLTMDQEVLDRVGRDVFGKDVNEVLAFPILSLNRRVGVALFVSNQTYSLYSNDEAVKMVQSLLSVAVELGIKRGLVPNIDGEHVAANYPSGRDKISQAAKDLLGASLTPKFSRSIAENQLHQFVDLLRNNVELCRRNGQVTPT